MDNMAHHSMANKQVDIAFLHTGEAHIKTFEAIVNQIAPTVSTHHTVQQEFLSHAMELGVDEQLESQMYQAIQELTLIAKVVVCTCSSIGAIAEKLDGLNGSVVQRIDRAMANHAINSTTNEHNSILVAAALQSTIEPTVSLITDSAMLLNKAVRISHCVAPNAWHHFEQGDLDEYKKEIARYLDSVNTNAEVIVLAQASMAGCEAYLAAPITVLSSPVLGVKAALAMLP